MERKAAKLEDQWPESFKVFMVQKWDMEFDEEPVQLQVSYLDSELTAKQRDELLSFLNNCESTMMQEWYKSVIPRLFSGNLSKEWVLEQEFARNLRLTCGIRIVLIFNFPCDTLTIPKDIYPLAFVLKDELKL